MYRTMPEAIKHNRLLLNLFSETEYEIQMICKTFFTVLHYVHHCFVV